MSAIELSNFLKQRANALNFSVTAISKKAGISRQTWYRLINADIKQIRIETLNRVAEALQVSLNDLSYFYIKKQNLQKKQLFKTIYISDNYPFIKEQTTSLDVLVGEEEVFEQQWKIVNKGKSHWINRRLVCVDEVFSIFVKNTNRELSSERCCNYAGLKPKHTYINLPLMAHGDYVIVSMQFSAPKKLGSIISFWKMLNVHGEVCFPDNVGLSCQVNVVGG